MSPSARSSRISALENMLSSSSSAMVSMASQLSEAEERERLFNGKGRWNHVRSLPDAKNIMNYLFQLASSARYAVLCFSSMHFMVVLMVAHSWFVGSYFLCSVFRCQVQDKEVVCNEKEHIISELKEQVVRLRQYEMQAKDLRHQNMQVMILLVFYLADLMTSKNEIVKCFVFGYCDII